MREFNVRNIEGDKVLVLNEIKVGSSLQEDRFIQVTDEAIADKLANTANDCIYNTTTNKIILEKPKGTGFDYLARGSKKETIALTLRNFLNSRTDAWTSINMVIYTQSMLELSDAGYIITDKNREEKYLEILETGNEDLIDLLENYLVLKDELTPIIHLKKLYNTTKAKLDKLPDDSPELDEILHNIQMK